LIDDKEMRQQVAPLDDPDLATAIVAVDRYAGSEAVQFAFWMGFRDDRITTFVEQNLPDSQLTS
jgi:hypothetical protein